MAHEPRRQRWRLVAQQIDTVILHLPRGDGDVTGLDEAAIRAGVRAGDGSHHLEVDPGIAWEPCGVSGRRAELGDGIAAEVGTQHAAGDLRVTLGPAWLWPRGGLDLEALRRDLGDLRGASVRRVDVAADFRAPDVRAVERKIVEFHQRCLEYSEHRINSPTPIWFGSIGGKHRGCEAASGLRGKAVQIRLYTKTSGYHWKNLDRYAAEWRRGGWRGVLCPRGHLGELGRPCPCGGGIAEPEPILRLEVEWPSRTLARTTLEDAARAVDWLRDPGGRGRRATLPSTVPTLLRQRILASGRARDRPRQPRPDPQAESRVVHWLRKANAAIEIADEIAELHKIQGIAEDLVRGHEDARAAKRARRRRRMCAGAGAPQLPHVTDAEIAGDLRRRRAARQRLAQARAHRLGSPPPSEPHNGLGGRPEREGGGAP